MKKNSLHMFFPFLSSSLQANMYFKLFGGVYFFLYL